MSISATINLSLITRKLLPDRLLQLSYGVVKKVGKGWVPVTWPRLQVNHVAKNLSGCLFVEVFSEVAEPVRVVRIIH